MLVLEWKERAFIEKVNCRCFCWFPVAILVHQNSTPNNGVSIQSSAKLRETFRQITQKLGATKTWDFDKLFIYLSFTTFHFLGFFHWTVSNLIFSCVTVKTIYVLTFDSHASALIASCIYKLDQINCVKHALNSNFLAILINEFIFSK